MAPRTWGDTLNLLIMIAENNILGIPANDAVDHDKKQHYTAIRVKRKEYGWISCL